MAVRTYACQSISIHKLHIEPDLLPGMYFPGLPQFQSTSSTQSQTIASAKKNFPDDISIHKLHAEPDEFICVKGHRVNISIHKLHAEPDLDGNAFSLPAEYFNPQAPRRARQQEHTNFHWILLLFSFISLIKHPFPLFPSSFSELLLPFSLHSPVRILQHFHVRFPFAPENAG